MHPAFSVIFLTTLLGAGQGLFLAMFTGQLYAIARFLPVQEDQFYALGSLIALLLLVIGLGASFFHLGRPERAWRSAAMWRTSWLSREVIILPVLMALVFAYSVAHLMHWTTPWFSIAEVLGVDATLLLGLLGTIASFALFVSTAMIYASVKFLEEWHSAFTVFNFTFLGLASGFTLAAAYSAYIGNPLVSFFGTWAVVLTLAALLSRGAHLMRNARLKHKSTVQTAIGVRHTAVVQKAQGAMGGSFNTREFFHGRSPETVRLVRNTFLVLVFPIPILLIVAAYLIESTTLPVLAFVIQYLGLIAERWYFFAEAKHPQNLYYQSIS
ncbi:sulfite dehydrogenase subunit SoeC [Thiocapsa bogorovii]|uniref:Sulfite oxidase membrane anchor subunit n=1 Tax=Thiocapsa roseopersicina TaxID=1058 RepID=X5ETK2_THIRO|nr:sulfite dehydrogenase subunit SoeC [Thiocapsa bogorovii]AHW76816.1 sulfite oxidase membrane anchor subunit [Thiocapsa roseopersicina]UHD15141.1 dimethyl sulfoxide reductase anchor subunit [Thiocapsa bogorovii]